MGKDLKGKELGDGICQRKNGVYQGRYIDRFGKRKCVYSKDLRELKRKLTEEKYENDKEVNIIKENTTLDEWFEKWLLVYKNDTIKENSKRHYVHIYKKHISPALGRIPISQVTQLQITALIKAKKKEGMQWETQNKIRVLLIDMFNRAMEDNFVRRNPAKGVRTASVKPKNERRILTQEEQALFFECSAGTFYNNLFVVAINTGLRVGELAALTWDCVDLKKHTITVKQTLVYQEYIDDTQKEFHLETPKTKTSHRKVPLNNQCENALKRQFVQKSIIARRNIGVREKELKPEFKDFLFTTKFNTPLCPQIVNDAIDRIVAELNLMQDDLEQIERFSSHTFRHTFATRCIEAGVKPKTLQKYLGHATLQMTMDLYVHITEDLKRAEMKLLEAQYDEIVITDDIINSNYKNETAKSESILFFKTV